MKIKEKFDRSILRINKDNTLSLNHEELTTIMRIIKNDKEQFSIYKEKLQIEQERVNECIQEHHDDSLQKYLKVAKTLQLLRQHC